MPLSIDSVYFLVFSGWRTEMQGSNWHYARRWAREVPVVIVEAELPAGTTPGCEPERRIENAEILSIRELPECPSFGEGLAATEQIISHMRRRNHRRPLLWLYDPSHIFPYTLLPAAGRVYHLVENYFDFPEEYGLLPDFIDTMKAAMAVSDKVLCFSRPALERYRAETGADNLEYLPIGCDYSVYGNPRPASGAWLDQVQPILAADTPIAVYGGNIDMKINVPLLHRLAEALRDVHFLYVGPVHENEFRPGDGADWRALLARPNVTHLGRLDIGDVPWLYRIADRGFIPYRSIPFFTKSAFPLKALEMAATGLPVVASLMQPLLAVPDAVDVATDEDAFIEKLGRASRRNRSPEAAARADAVCRAYDYDRLFEQMLAIMSEARLDGPVGPASLAALYRHIPLRRALWDLGRADHYAAEREAELARLRSHVASLENDREALRRERDVVLSSSFWRITGPARKLLATMPPSLRRQARRGARLAYWLATPRRIPGRVARYRSSRGSPPSVRRHLVEQQGPRADAPAQLHSQSHHVRQCPESPKRQPNPAQKIIISVHLPKTAGTSFLNALEQYFGDKLLLDYGARSKPPSCDLDTLIRNYEAIHGHFIASKYQPLGRRARFAIFFREPVARTISHYNFWRRNGSDDRPVVRQIRSGELSLVGFAEMPEIRSFYAHFLGGIELEKFTFIGLTEAYETSLALFNAIFGVKLGHIRDNVAPSDPEDAALSKEVLDAVKSAQQENTELYERARRRFDSLCEAYLCRGVEIQRRG